MRKIALILFSFISTLVLAQPKSETTLKFNTLVKSDSLDEIKTKSEIILNLNNNNIYHIIIYEGFSYYYEKVSDYIHDETIKGYPFWGFYAKALYGDDVIGIFGYEDLSLGMLIILEDNNYLYFFNN